MWQPSSRGDVGGKAKELFFETALIMPPLSRQTSVNFSKRDVLPSISSENGKKKIIIFWKRICKQLFYIIFTQIQ